MPRDDVIIQNAYIRERHVILYMSPVTYAITLRHAADACCYRYATCHY